MASIMEMEGIYVNVECAADVRPPTTETSPESPPRRFDGPVVVLVGLLNVLLLAGIIGLGFQSHHVSKELSIIKDNLTSLIEKWDLQGPCQKKISCPPAWKMFQCSCYFFSKLKKTWEESRNDCKDKDADLVVIHSFEEQEFLGKNRKNWTWIGLSDKDNEGIWKWTDGSQLTEEFWYKGQPDNYKGEEDCAHFRRSDTKWNDRGCKEPMHWICEKQFGT